MIEIKEEYKLLNDYLYLFNQQSINNETAGIISFFVIMGQSFRNQFVIPVGALKLDIRVSCFWLQDTRSGKSISWDFMNSVSNAVGLYCESPDEWSDAGLIGTIETDKNGEVIETEGLLNKCDILQIDEASSLFTVKNYNQSTILYLQKTLNYLHSKTNIITKQLKGGEITCKPHCSLWLTSFPPREMIEEVLDKGFFQRVIFYPNRISLDERKKVSGKRAENYWFETEKEEISVGSISTKIINLKGFYKTRNKNTLVPKDRHNALAIINNKIRGLFKLIEPMELSNQKIMASFLPNFENNMLIFSTILAISRKSEYVERIDIDQAYIILYEIFSNISSWIETERVDNFKTNREVVKIAVDLADENGWIKKSLFVKEIIKKCEVVDKTARNWIEKIQGISKKGGYIKIKQGVKV